MHFGSLPLEYVVGRSHLGSPESRPNDGLTRRALFGVLPAAVLFAGGAATSLGVAHILGSPETEEDVASEASRPPGPVAHGSLAWALWMLRAPAPDLIAAAGHLERVRVNTRGDRRLVPVFSRLLDVTITSDHVDADLAGAIAVRCLGKLGADHLLITARDHLDRREDRPATRSELRRATRKGT